MENEINVDRLDSTKTFYIDIQDGEKYKVLIPRKENNFWSYHQTIHHNPMSEL